MADSIKNNLSVNKFKLQTGKFLGDKTKIDKSSRDLDLAKMFEGENSFVQTLVANSGQFSDPIVRNRVKKQLEKGEDELQGWFDNMKESDLPKTIEEFHDIMIQSMIGAMNNCALKVTLGLIKEKTPEKLPGTRQISAICFQTLF